MLRRVLKTFCFRIRRNLFSKTKNEETYHLRIEIRFFVERSFMCCFWYQKNHDHLHNLKRLHSFIWKGFFASQLLSSYFILNSFFSFEICAFVRFKTSIISFHFNSFDEKNFVFFSLKLISIFNSSHKFTCSFIILRVLMHGIILGSGLHRITISFSYLFNQDHFLISKPFLSQKWEKFRGFRLFFCFGWGFGEKKKIVAHAPHPGLLVLERPG